MTFLACPESNQFYNDLLYWKDPLPCLEDHVKVLYSPVKCSVINNASLGSGEKSISNRSKAPIQEKSENALSEEPQKSIISSPPRHNGIKNEENEGDETRLRDSQAVTSNRYETEEETDVVVVREAENRGNYTQGVTHQNRHEEESATDSSSETSSSEEKKTDVLITLNANNNNSVCDALLSEIDSHSDDDSIDNLENVNFPSARTPKFFTFTYTTSDLFSSAVLRKRKLLPLSVMGNSSSHQQGKKTPKTSRASRHHSRRSASHHEKSDYDPSSSAKVRKKQLNDNSSVGSRLSGQYDDISVLSSGDVISVKSKRQRRLGSAEKIKSPTQRLSATSPALMSEDSTSTSRSVQDLLAYKPSLKTEFDFRKMDESKTVDDAAHSEENGRDFDATGGQDETFDKEDDTTDSTLLTLRGVCCAISSLQGKLMDSNDTAKSPDRLSTKKYTGTRHPMVSPSYPVLSTRTPMSPAQSPFNSPGNVTPAEPSSPTYTVKKPDSLRINPVSSTDSTSNITLTFPTVNTVYCDTSTIKNDQPSTLCDIMTSTNGFSGTSLRSWLCANSSDVKSEKFAHEFCDSLVRVGILVPKSFRIATGNEMSGKDATAASESKNIFNRLKFVPSQIYTWGPFSRLASNGNSPNKASTYKDFAVRQVEISPTVAPTEKATENGTHTENLPDTPPKNGALIPETDSSFGASSTALSSSFPSQNGSGDSVMENKSSDTSGMSSPFSPSGSNSSNKLGNVWPPPKPEDEDDVHKLKYSEAEHQHELMVLKRNHTEELYKITKDYETNIYEMNEEHTQDIESMQQEANLMRAEIGYLKAKLNIDKQDVSTQTQNVAQLRMTKGIQVNLTAESPPPQIALPTAEDVATSPAAVAAPPPPPPPPPPAPAFPAAPAPPPPPGGGPPPPPGIPFLKKDSPRRAPIEPKKPMKPLYWKRIQISKKELHKNKSVWVEIEDFPLNIEEVEEAFCKTTTSKKSKALSDSMTDKKKTTPAKVLENKRSQAVGIFISSLHVEMEDLQQAILNLDTAIVDEENMKAIYDLRATKKEGEDIKALYDSQKKRKEEERQPLDKPEKFLLNLLEIDHFEERMFCITFRTSFTEDVQEVQKELSQMKNALQELQDPSTVLRVLGLILNIGNYLNGGNRTRGQADGFQLDVLGKLQDVKGQRDNASLSLLNYLAWIYMRTYDQDVKYELRVCPVPTFQSIALASQVNFSDILKDLRRLRKELKECIKRVEDVINKSKNYKQPFRDIMEKFLDSANTSLAEQENDCLETQKRFAEAVDFFCVKSKSSSKPIEPKEFFALWQSFCMEFHTIWKVELKRLIKSDHQKARKLAEETRQKHSTTVVANVRRRPNSLKSRLMRSQR